MDKLKALIARALYSKALQSEAGQKAARWGPLAATAAWVLVTLGKVLAISGSTDAEALLNTLGIKPQISEVEITAAITAGLGLAKKLSTLYMQAQAQIVPPTQTPVLQTESQFGEFLTAYNKLRQDGVEFAKARELALQATIAIHAPVPVEKQVEMQTAADAEQAKAIVVAKESKP